MRLVQKDGKNAGKKRMGRVEYANLGRKNSEKEKNIATEGLAKILLHPKVFFNPAMHLCRDISSLWVGTLPRLDSILDGFCASGVRGLRYKLENSNVGHVVFADTQKQAAALAEKNSKLNGLGKSQYKIAKEDINKLLGRGDKFELIEIDPFGTPMPYLASVMRCGLGLDERFVSITATDTAVLCGAHAHACYKIYSARPLHSEICHEAGLRILLASIARAAAIEDWALKPMLCISHKHYFKVLAKLERGADAAVEAAKSSMYYITHCPHCLYHEIGKFPKNTCPFCQNRTSFAGPLWKGSWASKEVAGKMIELAKMRQYITKEAGLLLHTIFAEAEGPALYYDLHELASKHKRIIPSSAQIIEELQKQGYFASKTHFCQHAIRTDAMLGDILDKMQKR